MTVSGRFCAVVLVLVVGLGCRKKGSSPVAVPTPTKTATPYPPANTGIYWQNAEIYLFDYGAPSVSATLNLWVGGLPEATAAVTVSGSGVPGSMAMTYAGPATVSGQVYAQYKGSGVGYVPGTVYQVSTETSLGTVGTTVTAPGGITFAADKSWVSWSVPAPHYSFVGVHVPICFPGSGGCGWTLEVEPHAKSPVTVTSGYTSILSHDVYVTLQNSQLVPGASGGSALLASTYWKRSYP